MAGDPDDIWKPGYVGESPVVSVPADLSPVDPSAAERFDRAQTPTATMGPRTVQQVTFDAPPTEIGAVAVTESRRPRRRLAAVVLLAAALIVGGLFVNGFSGDESARPDVGEIAGADPRRMPERVDSLWSTTLDERRTGAGVRELIIHERSIVTVLDGDDDGSAMVALSVDDGSVQWRRRFEFQPTSVRILGAFDDLVVVEQNDVSDRRLLAMDLADGSTRWELPTADNGIHVALAGTAVITRVSFTGNERLTFIEPATGDEVARLEGRLVSTDLSGTWFVSNNQRVVSVDLTEGWSEPVEFVASGARFNEPLGVVDGRVLVMDDGILSEASTIDGQRTPLIVQPFGNDINANSLIATGGSSFVAVGDGKVVGASLGDDDIVTVEWTRDGSLRDGTLTAQGVVVSLVTDETGPAGRVVVDALTGITIVEAAGPLTDDEVPQVVRDGVVVTNTDLGLERVGYDLEGNERWRLAAPGAMRLGDRVLVTLEDTPDGYRISGFGDQP